MIELDIAFVRLEIGPYRIERGPNPIFKRQRMQPVKREQTLNVKVCAEPIEDCRRFLARVVVDDFEDAREPVAVEFDERAHQFFRFFRSPLYGGLYADLAQETLDPICRRLCAPVSHVVVSLSERR